MRDLTSEIDGAYLQQSVELTALTIVASSIPSPSTHIQSSSPTVSTNPNPSFILSSNVHLNLVSLPPPPPFIVNPLVFTPPIMAARYSPLVFPAPLANMPQDYQSKIVLFDGTGPLTTQQHVDKMNDCFDLQEVDEESVNLIMFSQSLGREVKEWFNSLPTNSINDLLAFHQNFLNRWEVKKNPLQIFSEYENIRREVWESVQDYCARFNKTYNEIPINLKPPQDLALIKFPDGFDADMSYHLRERNSQTLEGMQRYVVSVEANLQAKRERMRTEKIVTFREEESTSASEAKIDSLVRTMERMMERININDRNVPRENTTVQQNQNPNPRRNPPQIRQREQRGLDQQIRPPFQENYADEGGEVIEEVEENNINLMGTN